LTRLAADIEEPHFEDLPEGSATAGSSFTSREAYAGQRA
jgi:hypothetical protein